MSSVTYCFRLSIQTVLPSDYRTDTEFQQNLRTLQALGFYGVELNIGYPDRVDPDELRGFLKQFNLELTMFASGLTAKTSQLSLSSHDPDVRQQSVRKCREMIDFVAGTGVGIIVGFLKGGAVQDVTGARARFRESLQQIGPYAAENEVNILIEATNRYESAVANSLEETVALCHDLHNPFLRILPDTFHMNIEEADSFGALAKYAGYYESLHISDNNRYFPGFGAINFGELIRFLKRRNYQGGLAIEGNIRTSFAEDVQVSMKYLAPMLTEGGM